MTIKPNPGWRGDPTFLPEVLRAFGLEVRVLDGAFNRGHGDFGAIKGIIIHHIGSDRYDAWNIARHPTLGLCSQLHLSREGVVTLCGVGIAWHAGRGSYKGWPTNDANRVSIGIEAESNGTSPWPKAEMDAYYKLCAAILWFLGKRATTDTLLSHWEYSLEAQGKWDPGAGVGHGPRHKYDYAAMMNMNNFRAEVNKIIDAHNAGHAPGKGALVEAFDKIRRRFRSRVQGSSFEGYPIDYLLNADAHAFVSRANSEKILERLNEIEKKLEAQ